MLKQFLIGILGALIVSVGPAQAETYFVKNSLFPQDRIKSFYFADDGQILLKMHVTDRGNSVVLTVNAPRHDVFQFDDTTLNSVGVNEQGHVSYEVADLNTDTPLLVTIVTDPDDPEVGFVRETSYVDGHGQSHLVEHYWLATEIADGVRQGPGRLRVDGEDRLLQ